MINKILSAVFVALLVILLGEVGYLVYFQKSSPNLKEKGLTLPVSLTPKRENPWLEKIDKILTIYEGKPEIKLYFETEIEGKINKVGYNKDSEGYELKLVNDKNQKVNNFLIEEKNIKKILIFFADNKPANFLDLKVDDFIQWKSKENMKDSNDVEIVILLKNR